MSQHFLLSTSARTLSLAKVMRMTDVEAETLFASIRWPDTKGEPVCPHCGCFKPYTDRRPSGSLRFRCRDCEGSYSLTSGTLFAFHKLPLRTYLAADCDPLQRGQGQECVGVSRDLGRPIQDRFRPRSQNPRSHRLGNEGRARRRRGQGCRSRWRLFRRLCEACQSCREPPRSEVGSQSKWQTASGCRHPRTRRPQPNAGVQERASINHIHSNARQQGNRVDG